MGNKESATVKKRKLDFPTWCVQIPIKTEDISNCYQCWIKTVRTREDLNEDTTFKAFKVKFFKTLDEFTFGKLHDLESTDFLIRLISLLVHGKYKNTKDLEKINVYNIKPSEWDIIGRTLLVTIKDFYYPYEWTNDIHLAWVRIYSDFIRRILAF